MLFPIQRQMTLAVNKQQKFPRVPQTTEFHVKILNNYYI